MILTKRSHCRRGARRGLYAASRRERRGTRSAGEVVEGGGKRAWGENCEILRYV